MNIFDFTNIKLEDGTVLSSVEDIDYNITLERNLSINEIHKDVEDVSEIMRELSTLINEQGEIIDTCEKHIQDTENNTSMGAGNLQKAVEYIDQRLIILRDVAIVTGGGILGTTGFLLGPLVGMGTIIAGIAGGSATVAGIHKIKKK